MSICALYARSVLAIIVAKIDSLIQSLNCNMGSTSEQVPHDYRRYVPEKGTLITKSPLVPETQH